MNEVPGVPFNPLQFEDAPKPAPPSRQADGAIHCACGRKTCRAKIRIDTVSSSVLLWVEDHDNALTRDLNIYLDANGTVALIRQLQAGVRQLMEPSTP